MISNILIRIILFAGWGGFMVGIGYPVTTWQFWVGLGIVVLISLTGV